MGSRVIRILHPKTQWGWPEILAHKTNFLLETLVWQNGFNPKKKAEHERKKPKMQLPDFMKDPVAPSPINDGSVAMLPHEIDQWLSLPRA